MGALCSKSSAADAANSEIEKQLKNDQAKMKSEVKLLLLGVCVLLCVCACTVCALTRVWGGTGAGESGKSTVLKQMKILHHGGYTPEEREAYREIIWSNCIQSMQVLLRGMSTISPPVPFNDDDAQVPWRGGAQSVFLSLFVCLCVCVCVGGGTWGALALTRACEAALCARGGLAGLSARHRSCSD
jgi:hypothetical protein